MTTYTENKPKKQNEKQKTNFHAGMKPGDTVVITKKEILEKPKLPENSSIDEEILEKLKTDREKIIKALTKSPSGRLKGKLLGRSARSQHYTIKVEISPGLEVKGIFSNKEFTTESEVATAIH